MKRTDRRLILVSAFGAVSWLIGSSFLRAERPGESLTEPAYRELRVLSRSVDERAQHANDEARRRESWISRRDHGLQSSIADFARSARRFEERLANYRAAPWPVDDDLRTLLQGARDVQDRVSHSRFADGQTQSDWNEIVEMLGRMVKVSQSRDGLTGAPPAEPRRDEYGERRGPPGPRDSGEFAALARELDERADRAYGLAQRVAARGPYRREFFQSIRDFRDQAAAFRRSIESGAGGRRETRAEARRLLDFARRTDERMRRSNAFREVWRDWHRAMEILEKILNVAGG